MALAYHARAWEDIPTESQTITVLNFTPLLLQSFHIHGWSVLGCSRCEVCQISTSKVVRLIEGRREGLQSLGWGWKKSQV